ncbi:MAG: ribosome small subunit-dependent GTPase A [Clostridia bacterium]
MNGKILKGIGGFYYVKTAEKIVSCKARGSFRKDKITPCVGDEVDISIVDDEEGYILEIFPRKNQLVRPAVSNIDRLFIICSTTAPTPNTLLIDKSIALAEVKDIEPVIVFTKTDIIGNNELEKLYKSVGLKVFTVSLNDENSLEEIKKLLQTGISAFTGNSGVGKSTLLNRIMPELALETGETSKKLGRGKHTTRHVELFPTSYGGYVADTPGFSTLDFERFELIEADQIQYGFREFKEYLYDCKFSSCTHTCEKGCGVLKAVADEKISKSRLENYISMYNEVKDVKKWQKNV